MITPSNYLFTTDHGCGRYYWDPIAGHLHIEDLEPHPDFKIPKKDVRPTNLMPVIVQDGDKRKYELMKWGIVPAWAANKPDFGYTTFNARAETLDEKPMWKGMFHKSRCLVPASAYYEWKKPEKTQYVFTIKGEKAFTFAGLFTKWTEEKTGEVHSTYTIITTKPNSLQVPIHDRMPVILSDKQRLDWLDPDAPIPHLETLMDSYPSAKMKVEEVKK